MSKWSKIVPKPFRYLRFQLAAYYFLTSFIAVALLGSILYVSISDLFLKAALRETTSSVEDHGRLLDQYLLTLKTLSKTIAEDPDTIAFLEKGDSAAQGRISLRIDNILKANPTFYSAELVRHSAQVEKESWYALAMANMGMPVLTSARRTDFTLDKSTWVISLGQEILDEKGQHLGVFLIDFSYQVIEDQLRRLNLGAQGEAFILTTRNELVYHPNPEYYESKALQDELIVICKMGTGYDVGMNKLTHHFKLENADWLLVGLSSLDQLSVARRQIFETLIMTGILLLVIVLGSGLLIAVTVTRPIHHLQRVMLDFSTTLEVTEVASASSIEIDALRGQFNEMAKRIQRLMVEVTEKERYLRASEIKLLYSQINPHFLYNTLDTIVWMAEFQDSESVISITKALSQFFRISLSQGEDKIPLAKEFDHANQYLFIQSKRYSDKLAYHLELEPSAEEILVPKILLQPIVENAIYHGIKPLKVKGEIHIKAYLKEEALLIEISDNGIGFDARAALDRERFAEPQDRGVSKLGGVGLENVKKRLALFYGEAASMTIVSAVGEGTMVIISIKQK